MIKEFIKKMISSILRQNYTKLNDIGHKCGI